MPRRPEADEAFMAAVRYEFPTVATRQLLPVEAPAGAPHLILQSTSSQLAVSALQTDLQVRFYGDFVDDVARCREYLSRKMGSVLQGWEAVDGHPAFIGLILTVHFPLSEDDEISPIPHILERHVRSEVDAGVVNDAKVQLTVRVADHYFVNLTVGNYESKRLDRPILPGPMTTIVISPWEGTVDERGIELTIDVNTRLRAVVERQHHRVDQAELDATLQLAERIVRDIGASYVETGELDLASLAEEVA
jgi:hypothetical protein